jgi:hypothetical protein
MFEIAKVIASLALVPVLLLIAWREWIHKERESLPGWRNGIALAAFVIISLNWLAAILLDGAEFLHLGSSSLIGIKWITFHASHFVSLAAILSAFALKRVARLEALLAGLLMLTCWPGGYR